MFLDKTILLVEDDIVTQKLQKLSLEKYGYKVVFASSGEKALEIINNDKTIDLILMDIDLGEGVDGTEAAEEILKIREIPLLFLSSHTESDIVEKTEKITSYGYVVKNTGITVLDASIKMAFKLFEANQKTKIIKKESEKREKRLNSAEKIANLGSWELDLITGNLVWSDETYRIFGLEPKEIDPTYETFLKMIHPDDIDMVNSAYTDSIKNGKDCYEIVHRVIRKNTHEIRFVFEKCEHIRDDSGKIVRSIGMIHDVTESKKIEEELIESNNFNESILKTIPFGMEIVDSEGTVLFQNEVLEKQLGKSGLGEKCWKLYRDDQIQCKGCPLNNKIEIGKTSLIESPYIMNGKTFSIYHTGTIFKGKVSVLEIFIDVTERKQFEENLKESHDVLRKALKISSELINADPDIVNYNYLADTMIEISGAKYCSFNIFDENGFDFTTVALTGVTGVKADLIKASSFLGFDVIGKKWKSDTVRTEKIKDNPVTEFNSLIDLSGTVLPKIITNLLGKTFKLGKVFVVKITKNNLSLGDFTLIFSKEESLKNQEILEIIANQVGFYIDRLRVEKKLKISEKKFRTFADFTNDWEYWDDKDGNIIYMTPSCERICGYNFEEFLSGEVRLTNIVHPDDVHLFDDHYKETHSSEYFKDMDELDFRIIKKDGSLAYLGHLCRPIFDDEGNYLGRRISNRDITDRKNAEEKIKSLLFEKELILKEVHHRIKNNLLSIQGYLILQAETVHESQAVSALIDAGNRVESLMILYEKLYQSEIFGEISILKYFPALIDEIIANFPNNKKIAVAKNIEDFALNAEILQSLGIIINELLTNIMKYAFTDKNEGKIEISAELKESLVIICVEDNGGGIPSSVDFENSTGFGLMLVGMLVKQVKGKIRIERNNGTKFILEFKKL